MFDVFVLLLSNVHFVWVGSVASSLLVSMVLARLICMCLCTIQSLAIFCWLYNIVCFEVYSIRYVSFSRREHWLLSYVLPLVCLCLMRGTLYCRFRFIS